MPIASADAFWCLQQNTLHASVFFFFAFSQSAVLSKSFKYRASLSFFLIFYPHWNMFLICWMVLMLNHKPSAFYHIWAENVKDRMNEARYWQKHSSYFSWKRSLGGTEHKATRLTGAVAWAFFALQLHLFKLFKKKPFFDPFKLMECVLVLMFSWSF